MKTQLKLILVSVFFSGCISNSFDRGNFIPADKEPVEIGFEMLSNLIVIEAEINGVSGKFIFDNGAALSLINQAFSENAQINFDGLTQIRDANNNKSTIPEATVDKVVIGNQMFQGTGFYQTNTDAYMPCNEIDGIIGASIINKANWRINFEKKKIEISSTPFKSNGKKLPISISKNNSSFATISILGVSYKSKIDLGSTKSIKIDRRYSDNSFEGLLAEQRLGIISASANGLGKTDTVYRLYDKLPIVNSVDTLQAYASVMINSKLKYPGYIGLDYFNDYSELIINSTEQEYILGSPKESPQENVRSSYGLSIYRIDNVWRIIQIDANDPTLSEIDLMDEVLTVDDVPIEHYESICDYQEYLKMKIKKKDSLVVILKDSISLKLPFRQNKTEKVSVYNKQ
jgi:hypothetical protein